EAQTVQKKLKVNDRMVGAMLEALGNALMHQGKLAEAEACFREALTNASTSPSTEYYCRRNLGGVLMEQRKFSEAEAEFRVAVEISKNIKALNSHLAWSVELLESALKAQGKSAEAEAVYRKEIESRVKETGEEDSIVNRWRNNLFILLHAERKAAEADAV